MENKNRAIIGKEKQAMEKGKQPGIAARPEKEMEYGVGGKLRPRFDCWEREQRVKEKSEKDRIKLQARH